jgi:hypothetical protein
VVSTTDPYGRNLGFLDRKTGRDRIKKYDIEISGKSRIGVTRRRVISGDREGGSFMCGRFAWPNYAPFWMCQHIIEFFAGVLLTD